MKDHGHVGAHSGMPWEDEPAVAPPLRTGAAVPTDLPRRRRFVGREDALRAVDEALAGREAGSGMATLHGLAGSGKKIGRAHV